MNKFIKKLLQQDEEAKKEKSTKNFPTVYIRYKYRYRNANQQDRKQAYDAPTGIPQHLIPQFNLASSSFREFNTDCSGLIEWTQFKNAMHGLGYSNKSKLKILFQLADQDGNGYLNEREFCEFWVYCQNFHNPGYQHGAIQPVYFPQNEDYYFGIHQKEIKKDKHGEKQPKVHQKIKNGYMPGFT